MPSFRPTASASRAAKSALSVRENKPPSQRGMTRIGLARARQFANREPMSLDTVKRVLSFLSRHLVDKEASTWEERGKGWQAWNGWGGDAGARWARRIVQREDPEWYANWREQPRNKALIRATS